MLLDTQTNYSCTTLHIIVNKIQVNPGRLGLSGPYSTAVTSKKMEEASCIDYIHAVLYILTALAFFTLIKMGS